VPGDHLVVNAPRHAFEIEGAALLAEPREKDDLEEEVTELTLELLPILAGESLEDFVALLEKVSSEVAGGLLPVSRALLSKSLHERHESTRGVRIFHRNLPAFT
jgi:hypothetical protein